MAGLNHFVQMDRLATELVFGHLDGMGVGLREAGLKGAVVGVAGIARHAIGGELGVFPQFHAQLCVASDGLIAWRTDGLGAGRGAWLAEAQLSVFLNWRQ